MSITITIHEPTLRTSPPIWEGRVAVRFTLTHDDSGATVEGRTLIDYDGLLTEVTSSAFYDQVNEVLIDPETPSTLAPRIRSMFDGLPYELDLSSSRRRLTHEQAETASKMLAEMKPQQLVTASDDIIEAATLVHQIITGAEFTWRS